MLILYGKVQRYGPNLQMNSPEFEIVAMGKTMGSYIPGRIVPDVLSPKDDATLFPSHHAAALDEYVSSVSELLPYDIRSRHNLLNLARV